MVGLFLIFLICLPLTVQACDRRESYEKAVAPIMSSTITLPRNSQSVKVIELLQNDSMQVIFESNVTADPPFLYPKFSKDFILYLSTSQANISLSDSQTYMVCFDTVRSSPGEAGFLETCTFCDLIEPEPWLIVISEQSQKEVKMQYLVGEMPFSEATLVTKLSRGEKNSCSLKPLPMEVSRGSIYSNTPLGAWMRASDVYEIQIDLEFSLWGNDTDFETFYVSDYKRRSLLDCSI